MMKLDYWKQDVAPEWSQYQPRITEIHNRLMNKEDAYTGWVDWPTRVERDLIEDIAYSGRNS